MQERKRRTSPVHEPSAREGGGSSNNSFTHPPLGTLALMDITAAEVRGSLVWGDFNISAMVLAFPTALSKRNLYIPTPIHGGAAPDSLAAASLGPKQEKPVRDEEGSRAGLCDPRKLSEG